MAVATLPRSFRNFGIIIDLLFPTFSQSEVAFIHVFQTNFSDFFFFPSFAWVGRTCGTANSAGEDGVNWWKN